MFSSVPLDTFLVLFLEQFQPAPVVWLTGLVLWKVFKDLTLYLWPFKLLDLGLFPAATPSL